MLFVLTAAACFIHRVTLRGTTPDNSPFLLLNNKSAFELRRLLPNLAAFFFYVKGFFWNLNSAELPERRSFKITKERAENLLEFNSCRAENRFKSVLSWSQRRRASFYQLVLLSRETTAFGVVDFTQTLLNRGLCRGLLFILTDW